MTKEDILKEFDEKFIFMEFNDEPIITVSNWEEMSSKTQIGAERLHEILKSFISSALKEQEQQTKREVVEEFSFVAEEVGQYYLNGEGAKNRWWQGVGEGILRFQDFMNNRSTGDTPRRLFGAQKKYKSLTR